MTDAQVAIHTIALAFLVVAGSCARHAVPCCAMLCCAYAKRTTDAQVAIHTIALAFLVVAGSCALMIPVMLYIFQLQHSGWQWPHAALFGSMLASTDAVAIVATMKSSEYASAPLEILRCDRLQSVLSAL